MNSMRIKLIASSISVLLPLLFSIPFFYASPLYLSDIGITMGAKSLDIMLHLNKLLKGTFKLMLTANVVKKN